MRWDEEATSNMDNVEIRRGGSGGGGFSGMGGLPIPVRGGGILSLVLVLAMFVLPRLLGSGGPGSDVVIQQPGQVIPGSVTGSEVDDSALNEAPTEGQAFAGWVFNDVQTMWQNEFSGSGQQYRDATLVLFSDVTATGCGTGQAGMGPFYCPVDERVYIDLAFYDELVARFGAPGDFAQAYVIAHEVAHHVQNLLGISGEVQRLSRQNPDQANALSIRLELQADCMSGVWARSVYLSSDAERGIEEGDIEEGLTAAAAVGDDNIQRQTTGRVDPESWNHGSSEQRVKWFKVGFDSGESAKCDTFKAESL